MNIALTEHSTEHSIDVRPMPGCERLLKIFGRWAKMSHGESILLLNDHDPVPFYYPFAAEHTGTFRWDYLEQGPDVFRVRITKGDFADPGFVPTVRPTLSCSTPQVTPIEVVQPLLLDTRPIFAAGQTPCQAIDDATASLTPGQPLVLIVPFEPVPLYAKLGNQGFTHQTKQLDDHTWQAEFRKTDGG